MIYHFLFQAHDLTEAMIVAFDRAGMRSPWPDRLTPRRADPDAHWPAQSIESIPLTVDATSPGEVPRLVGRALRELLDVDPLLQPDSRPAPGEGCVRVAMVL